MFIIEKIISMTLLSPLPFILIFLYIGFKNILNRKIKSGLVLILIGIGTYLGTCDFFIDSFLFKLESAYPIISTAKLQEGDVYILLGGGITPNTSGGNVPADGANARIIKTAQLYNKYPKNIYISGGSPLQDKESESSVYKRELTALGIPAENIIIEEKSRNTRENAVYIRKMMEEAKERRAVLITSAFHMLRSVKTFDDGERGMVFYPAPCDFMAKSEPENFFDYIPKYSNFKKLGILLKEYVGIVYYKIRY